MADKKKAITIKIPIGLNATIETFVKVYNEKSECKKLSKSEFIEIACIDLLTKIGVIQDKESKDRKEK